jgi:hypothetical protein
MKMRTLPSVASQTVLCLLLGALLCFGSSAFAQNSTIFGPNVYVFTPGNSASSINSTLSTLASYGQFDTRRAAVLFEPGTYTGIQSEVGFYESIAGLGQTPSAVNLNQSYLESNGLLNGNDTQTFWRSIENMEMTTPGSGTLQWGVSQGDSFRRMLVNNSVELTDSGCNYASGGFIANSKITGQLNACDQQQWYTRNSSIGSWAGGSWNMVFSGVSGAPGQTTSFGGGGSSYTVLATTPVSREKPFLYMDSGGNYWVFSPKYGTNTSGVTWANGGVGSGEAGTSLAISTFLIATPSTSLASINSALAAGDNLILTPGIYKYSGSINVTNANTVVLGLGYADLVPQSGTAALTVADVGGVQLAGFLIDAGPTKSAVLLQIGVKGASRASHATNPSTISDVHFRIGGATLGTCTTATEIDSDNVIIDDMWSWRADHGNGGTVGWNSNVCQSGLVVNGDFVLATGLAVEHYEGRQVEWNGENGETIFYQSEMPYDVPSQSAWSDGGVEGYASYNVASTVTNHLALGLGVYSVFDQGVNIIANSGIAAPVAAQVGFRDAMTVTLASGQTNYVIASNNGTVDNGGGMATSYVTSWGNTTGGVGSGGGPPPTEGPYPGPAAAAVPGTVMAENYDTGGQGLGYSVSSTNGSANSYRSDGVDLEAATSPATGNDLGWSAGGQWFRYTVNAATAGAYTVSFLVASPTAVADGFHLSNSSGTNLSGSVAVPATGGYQTWVTVTANVTLPAGTQTLTLSEDTAGWNIDSLKFASSGGSCTTKPNAPTGLAASGTTSTGTTLNWTADTAPANCSISSYTVLKGGVSIGTATGTSFAVSGLTASTNYSFTVEATDAAGTSAASSAVSVTTTASSCTTKPNAPTGLAASGTTSTGTTLAWTADTAPANCSISNYTVLKGGVSIGTATGTSFAVTGLAASTNYSFTVEASDAAGTSAASSAVSVTTSASGGEGPYPGPAAAAVPGTVMAENYDTGGQGVAYNVTSTNGTANTYRSQGVDLEAATAPATGNNLGWSAAGQWFRYTVNVSTAGFYQISFLVASPTAVADAFHISNSSGTNLTGSIAVPATGGYQTWVTVRAAAPVSLPAGQQTLTLSEDAAGWNIDSIAFVASSGGGGSTLQTGTPYNIVNENSGSCVSATGSGTANGTTVTQNVCAGGTVSTQTSQQWTFTNGTATGYYEVTNVNAPAEAWNVTNNGVASGSLMQLWAYTAASNEEWEAVSLGNGYYQFVGQGSGLCLDTPGASTANGVQLEIFTCNGTTAQAFKLVTP